MNKNWIMRWKNLVAETKLPNVWERKEGGHLVRARVVDPTTGRLKEIKKVMPEADAATAYKWLEDEKARVRAGVVLVMQPKTRFADYAVSLLERKVATREIKSAKNRETWRYTLEHLIAGVGEPGTASFVPGFGDCFMDQIRVAHVEAFKTGAAKLVAARVYSPNTVNGWLSRLRVILRTAKRELGLAEDATAGVLNLDCSEHDTYSEEEPNSLVVEEVGPFLSCVRELYPQHYAMTYVGFATGLRPSTLRPIRRTGPKCDVLWDENVLLVRRSQTVGDEVMDTTKTKRKQRISVPTELMDVLRWHIETQLTTPEQRASDLLFPSTKGGYRAPCVLNDPFAEVAATIELGKHFTQRGMRRTFQDLARAAKVADLIQMSISGHVTEKMKDHYSTVNAVEQRESIGKILRIMDYRSAVAGGAPGGAPEEESGAPNKKAG